MRKDVTWWHQSASNESSCCILDIDSSSNIHHDYRKVTISCYNDKWMSGGVLYIFTYGSCWWYSFLWACWCGISLKLGHGACHVSLFLQTTCQVNQQKVWHCWHKVWCPVLHKQLYTANASQLDTKMCTRTCASRNSKLSDRVFSEL